MVKREDTIKELIEKLIENAKAVGASGWAHDQGFITQKQVDEAEIDLLQSKAELLDYLGI